MSDAGQPATGPDLETIVEQEKIKLEDEREKHRKRAEKFGVDYRDPGQTRREFRDDFRKERFARSGFSTGFDPFTAEEVEKRAQRAERFQMQSTGLEWKAPEIPEDEEKRRQRAARFGVDYQPPDETGLMDVDLFEERKDAPTELPRRPEAIHVYGVDLLSTADLLKYFSAYGPTYVEWLNDSSANVLFGDGGTAKRALAGLGSALPSDNLPEGVDVQDPANMEYLWHKGADFHKSGSDIPIVMRVATVLDVKPAERVQSRRLWVNAGGVQKSGGRGGRGGRKQRDRFAGGRGRGRKGEKVVSGWQHDDRFGGGYDGGGEGGQPKKGRGKTRYTSFSNKIASGNGGVQMEMGPGADVAASNDPPRDQVSYEDL